jgi:hypothetical protein
MKTSIKTSIVSAIVLFIGAVAAHALNSCVTNVDIYCVTGNQVSTSQNGSSTSPTNEVHGGGATLMNTTGDQNGVYINFYGTCSTSDQVIAVIIYSCNDSWCGLGPCSAGSYAMNVTLPAGCDIVSGYLGYYAAECCRITWNPMSCHSCTAGGGQQ